MGKGNPPEIPLNSGPGSVAQKKCLFFSLTIFFLANSRGFAVKHVHVIFLGEKEGQLTILDGRSSC